MCHVCRSSELLARCSVRVLVLFVSGCAKVEGQPQESTFLMDIGQLAIQTSTSSNENDRTFDSLLSLIRLATSTRSGLFATPH